MTEKNHDTSDYSIKNLDITPREVWWAFCPGSNTIDWIKQDKSDYSIGLITFGYVFEPAKDLIKIAIYGSALVGIIAFGAAEMGHPELMQSLEGILVK